MSVSNKSNQSPILKWADIVSRRSIAAFFAISLLILMSAIFIRVGLESQRKMLEVATITSDQRLLVSELSQRLTFMLKNSSNEATDRFVNKMRYDIKQKAIQLRVNQNQLIDTYKKNHLFSRHLLEIFHQDKRLLEVIDEIDENLSEMNGYLDLLMKASPEVVKSGFNFWNPNYLKIVSSGEHARKISDLNEIIRQSAMKQNDSLSIVHLYLLIIVFVGMWLIWLFVLKPTLDNLRNILLLYGENQKKLEYQANHDALTGLFNRQSFAMVLNDLDKDRPFRKNRIAILIMDVDNFKITNDKFGHVTGDTVLRSVADSMRRRQSEDEMLFRIGGDEFVILINDCKSKDYAISRAKNLCNISTRSFLLNDLSLDIKISIGISFETMDFNTCSELMAAADYALYHVKEGGGNGYSEYSEIESRSIASLLSFERKLGMAVAEQRFEVFYQPVVRLLDGKIVGLEALARWKDEKGVFLSPDQWLAISRKNGLITKISLWILKQIETNVQTWHSMGVQPVHITINATESMLTTSEMLELLKNSQPGIEEGRKFSMGVEIPESIILDRSYTAIVEQLNLIREQGYRVLLDDFGTGYATLTHLVSMPFDVIKIDKSFVLDLITNSDSRIIVETLIGLAHNLKKDVICEGVEDYETMLELKRMGCKYVQGYFYSKPLPFNEVTPLLTRGYL